MDLNKNGKLLAELRAAKGLTQKQVADKLGLVPKTISKWETGHGFPDISYVSKLSEIYGVSTETILSGNLVQNKAESGNVKRTKFYVCPQCGSVMYGTGNFDAVCCGKHIAPLISAPADDKHIINISETDNEFYITINHEMTKEHFIQFIAYVTFDRILLVRLYPEQMPEVYIPKMYGGKFYYYCNKHGLFESA